MSNINNATKRSSSGNAGARKRKKDYSNLKFALLSIFMSIAVGLGVFAARWYTTPHSETILQSFEEGTLNEVVIDEQKSNILIIGTDVSGLLTDVIMLVQIDPVKKQASVMSIPRDTYIKYQGYKGKINGVHATFYDKEIKSGSEATIRAVKQLMGEIPIHHYVKVNTKALRQCIDELGGVDFYVPQNMKYTDPAQDLYIDLKKGQQHLDGDKAEQLVRFRQYKNGDIGRIKVQQDFIHAVMEQKLNIKYVGEIGDIYSVLISNLETSMAPEEAIKYGNLLLEIGRENVETITLPHRFVEGKSYVVPVMSEIVTVREQYFGYDKEGNEI